jgi:predicted O-linked N-acetylglucosamine transferase (SPINDLY family)
VEINELPALSAGHVTFGCLNKLVKVTPGMLRLWARILEAVPGSRLKLMVSKYDPGDPMLWEMFESCGGGVLKHTLRERMGRSALRDEGGFTGRLEGVYRTLSKKNVCHA